MLKLTSGSGIDNGEVPSGSEAVMLPSLLSLTPTHPLVSAQTISDQNALEVGWEESLLQTAASQTWLCTGIT